MTPLVLHSARPTPLPRLLHPGLMIRDLWSHRDLLGQFSARYFRSRHRGTHLGLVWAVISPLMLLSVYTFVFNFVFSARLGANPAQTRSQYAVLLFCGITVYGLFSETVVRSCGLVLDNPNYVKKVVFPLQVLAPAHLLSSLQFGAIGLGLVVIGTWVFFHAVPWTVVLIPAVLAPMLCLALGLSWFLSSLGVFVRDVGNIVVIIVSQLLFFMTPIFYSMDNLPARWKPIIGLNPLAPIVEGARRVMVLGEQPDWASLGVVFLVGLAALQLGYAWFMKSKRGFADVL